MDQKKKREKLEPRIPSGFTEYLPGEQIVFNHLMDLIRSVYELFGFMPIETPAVEFTKILQTEEGENQKLIYQLVKHRDRDTDNISLHFDLTVPLARYVSEHHHELNFPFRRYQMQKVWRGERSQKGRFREFYQLDADVIGSKDVMTDAEMPSVIHEALSRLGFTRFIIRMNNRKMLNGLLEEMNMLSMSEQVLRAIDKLDKYGREKVSVELEAAGVNHQQIAKIFEFLDISGSNKEMFSKLRSLDIKSPVFMEGLNEISLVFENLPHFNVPETCCKIDLSVARGLDYYTGMVFETTLEEYPQFGSVCSGGRYDNLVSKFSTGNKEKEESSLDLPGIGVSIGLTRLFASMKEAGLVRPVQLTSSQVLITPIGDQYRTNCVKAATYLRRAGIKAETYFEAGSMKRKLRYAQRLRIPAIIFIGENEARENKITLKLMESGTQMCVSVEEAANQLRNKN